MDRFKHKTIFSFVVRPVVSKEKDALLSVASLEALKKFIPDVKTDTNVDLLPVAFNACVVNRFNANDDGVSAGTAIAMAPYFVNKQINSEHNSNRICGVILSSAYSEFGTDKELTEEQCKTMAGPFNMTLGGVIWRRANEDLADIIEECSDPSSPNYLKVSASWELGFSEFDLAVSQGESRNLADCSLISDPVEVAKLEGKLRCRGGNGRVGPNQRIYRLVKGDVLPLGIGLTTMPAADVRGIAVNNSNPEQDFMDEMKKEADQAKDMPSLMDKVDKMCKKMGLDEGQVKNVKERMIQYCGQNRPDLLASLFADISDKQKISLDDVKNAMKQSGLAAAASSLSTQQVVKEISSMKFTSIKEITDDSLKQATASTVTEFIQDELRKASEKYSELEKRKQESDASASKKSEELAAEIKSLNEKLTSLQKELDTLRAEKAEKDKVEVFNQRMASLDEVYELNADDRKVLAAQVKEMSNDQFKAFEQSLTVLLKDKSKEARKTANASTQQIVDRAVNNADPTNKGLPNTTDPDTGSISNRFKKAFARDQIEVKLGRR